MQVPGKQCVEVGRGGADVTSWLRTCWTLRHCWCAMCRGLVGVRICMRAGHKCGWWVCTRAYSLCAWWVRAHVSSMCKHPMWACTRVHSSCVGVFCLCVHCVHVPGAAHQERDQGLGQLRLAPGQQRVGPLCRYVYAKCLACLHALCVGARSLLSTCAFSVTQLVSCVVGCPHC